MLWRVIPFFVLSFTAASPFFGENGGEGGALDPAFRKVPFEEWFAGNGQGSIKWSVRVVRPQLSSHQRLAAQIEVLLDGKEIAKRLAEGGEMLVFVEVDDATKRAYQNHV